MRCGSQAIRVRKATTIASPGSTANLVKGVNGVLGPSASVKRRLSVRLNEVNRGRRGVEPGLRMRRDGSYSHSSVLFQLPPTHLSLVLFSTHLTLFISMLVMEVAWQPSFNV